MSNMAEEILAGWDDEPQGGAPTEEEREGEEPEVEVGAGGEEEEDSEEGLAASPSEEGEESDEDEGAPVEDEGEEEPPTADEEEAPASTSPEDDPEVQALLARYGGDPLKALKGHVELKRVLDRQGYETGQLRQRVSQLEDELSQQAAWGQLGGGRLLSPEQQEWVEQATTSGQPLAFVQQAVQAGEFGLARAVTDAWAAEDPYQAIRVAQLIDQAEYAAAPVPEYEGFEPSVFVNVLSQHYPDMPSYEPQMVEAVQRLGHGHPLVVAARSADPQEAMRGWVGLYEIAKASSATVKEAKAKVKQKNREAAATARDGAVVTSGSASPAATQTPPARRLMPGLTWEQLEAEWTK